jgi:hypothetical protein
MLISSMYTLLAAGIMSPCICKKTVDNTYVSITSSKVKCFQGEWRAAAFLIYGFLIFYGLLFPGYLAVMFWRNRNDPTNPEFERRFGHLTQSYKVHHFYWELVGFAKRLSFAAISQTTPLYDSSDLTPYFLLTALLFIFNWLEHVFMPFRKHSSSVRSFMWNSVALIMLLCDGFVFKSPSTPKDQKDLFGGFMVAMIAAACTFVLVTTIFETRQKKKEEVVKNIPDTLKSTAPSSIEVTSATGVV